MASRPSQSQSIPPQQYGNRPPQSQQYPPPQQGGQPGNYTPSVQSPIQSPAQGFRPSTYSPYSPPQQNSGRPPVQYGSGDVPVGQGHVYSPPYQQQPPSDSRLPLQNQGPPRLQTQYANEPTHLNVPHIPPPPHASTTPSPQPQLRPSGSTSHRQRPLAGQRPAPRPQSLNPSPGNQPLQQHTQSQRPHSVASPQDQTVRPAQFFAQAPRASTPAKRLVVACDGTWLDADSLASNSTLAPPSNVARICRAIKATSSDSVPQVVYYQAGLGTSGPALERFIGGATAEGISANIRDGYAFLCDNYTGQEEVFLIGFSRGAFTARSIAGLVDSVGILTKRGVAYLAVIFNDWEHRSDEKYQRRKQDQADRGPVPGQVEIPFNRHGDLSASDPEYRIELERLGLTSSTRTKIKAIGVFDTVGSLGIPRLPFLSRLTARSSAIATYRFDSTSLLPSVENAFQALALDEERAAFTPAVWERPKGNTTTVLRQVWFPGVHSNIGGGYDDQELSNITLAWMVSQLEPFIDFDMTYLEAQFRDPLPTVPRRKGHSSEKVPYAFGRIYNSLTSFWSLGGRRVRTPGQFHRVDPRTGRETSQLLRQTNEFIHPSVRVRICLGGPPSDLDRKSEIYDPAGLRKFKLTITNSEDLNFEEAAARAASQEGPSATDALALSAGAEPPRVNRGANAPLAVWTRKEDGVKIAESPLWATERKLLALDETAEAFVFEEGKARSRRKEGGKGRPKLKAKARPRRESGRD